MFIAVDIGNTTIAFAILKGAKIVERKRLDTHQSVADLKKQLGQLFSLWRRKHGKARGSIICSVVPDALKLVERSVVQGFGIQPLIVGKDVRVPIKNHYRKPQQVGQDRLVGAYAAKILYGQPAIIIDLGTAITFDVISHKGEYLGGAIVPGIRLSAEALYKKTALLPQIEIRAPKKVIGQTTQESILSGLFFGYGCLCQGFIQMISSQIKGRPKVILTGGHTHLMKRFIESRIRVVDEDLVLRGLYLLNTQNGHVQ